MPYDMSTTNRFKKVLFGLSLLMLATLAQAVVPNPYKKSWQCTALKGKWSCAEVMQKTPVHPQGSLEIRRQYKLAVANQLGWIQNTSDTKVFCSVCPGHYYIEPLPGHGQLFNPSASKTIIDHIQKSQGNLSGYVSLTGPVKITQPSRVLYADNVTLKRNNITKRLQFVHAKGHLRLHQPTSLLLGDKGQADLASNHASIVNANYLYKVSAMPGAKGADPNFLGYAHGSAKTIKQLNQNVLTFDDTTYSTCPPIKDTWELNAKHLNLNKTTGRGHAYNMILKVQRIPIFYTPFFSFPLDNKRYSGFLYPMFGGSPKRAWFVFPYYFNLAPNLDDTLYPITYSTTAAHLQAEVLHNKFRYLFGFNTPVAIRTSGAIDFDALVYQKITPDIAKTLLKPIAKNQPVKGLPTVVFTNNTTFGAHLSTQLTYQYIRDQAFLNVYPNIYNGFAKDQTSIVRMFNAAYSAQYWNANLLVRKDDYFSQQTVNGLKLLHVANQVPATLPQLDFTISPPTPTWVNTSMSGQFLNAVKPASTNTKNGVTTTFNQGIRYHLAPHISFPITPGYGFFTPEASLFLTKYHFRSVSGTSSIPTSKIFNPNASLAVPIFDLHTGLYFDRHFKWADEHFQQTVEPELFYLYVPYQNQYTVPFLSDTSYTAFTYSSLFSKNRFVGFDRIGDANQLSAALSTTISNDKGSSLHLGVGQIFYFRDRLVNMTCKPTDVKCMLGVDHYYQQKRSSYAGTLDYSYNFHFHFHSDLTYNPISKSLDNQAYILQYLSDTSHVINIGYTSGVHYNLLTPEQRLQGMAGKSQSLLTLSSIWKVSAGWSLIGSLSYSVNDNRIIDAFGGFKYDSCCWSVQFISEGVVDGIDPNNPGDYSTGTKDRRFVFSFSLKGLGGVDQSEVNELLSRIPGSGVTSTTVE